MTSHPSNKYFGFASLPLCRYQRLFNLNETVLCNERTLSLAQIGNSFKMILKMFHVCTHYRRLDYLPYQISHFSLNTDADQGCIRRAKVWVQYLLICQNLRLWKEYLLVQFQIFASWKPLYRMIDDIICCFVISV